MNNTCCIITSHSYSLPLTNHLVTTVRHSRGPTHFLPHLSTTRVAALLLRPFSFVSVLTRLTVEARFADLQEIIDNKAACLFYRPRNKSQRQAVLPEGSHHLRHHPLLPVWPRTSCLTGTRKNGCRRGNQMDVPVSCLDLLRASVLLASSLRLLICAC